MPEEQQSTQQAQQQSNEGQQPEAETPRMAGQFHAGGGSAYEISLEDAGDGEEGGEAEAAAEYRMELDERYKLEEPVVNMLQETARESGLSAAAGGKFMNGVLGKLTAMQEAKLAADDKALREEWGAEFKGRVERNKRYMAQVARKAGLSAADLAVFNSAAGQRLVDVIRRVSGESGVLTGGGGAEGGGAEMTAAERRKILNDMRTDPKNPWRNGLINPLASAAERRAAKKEYNRVAGYTAFPV